MARGAPTRQMTPQFLRMPTHVPARRASPTGCVTTHIWPITVLNAPIRKGTATWTSTSVSAPRARTAAVAMTPPRCAHLSLRTTALRLASCAVDSSSACRGESRQRICLHASARMALRGPCARSTPTSVTVRRAPTAERVPIRRRLLGFLSMRILAAAQLDLPTACVSTPSWLWPRTRSCALSPRAEIATLMSANA